MTEFAPIDDHQTNFFTSENPPLLERSTEWSNKIHRDPSPDNAFRVLNEAFSETLSNNSSMEPHAARLFAAQVARGSVARVIAHHATVKLAPVVTQLLEGDDSAIEESLQDARIGVVSTPDAGITTDFGRIWYGDDARLLLMLGLLTEGPNRLAIDDLPAGLRASALQSGIWVNRAAHDLVIHRGLKDEMARLASNESWGEKPMGHFVLGQNAVGEAWAEKGNWQDRYLLVQLAAVVATDARSFLSKNTRVSIEHTAALTTDGIHELLSSTEAGPSDIASAFLANLHLAHVLAFMANELNGRAEYDKRYTWKEPEGPDRSLSPREPLVRAVHDDRGYMLIPNPSSKLSGITRSKRNRCPGPDALEPISDEEEHIIDRLRGAIKTTIASYGDEVLSRHDRNYSHVDTLTVLGAIAAKILMEKGFVTFDDVADHLGPPEQATSNGTYILNNPIRKAVSLHTILSIR